MSTADTIPDPGHRARTLKDTPFQSLEEFLDTVSWRIEHEARKLAGRRTPQDQEDLFSEGLVAMVKVFDKRGASLHTVSGKWIHVVARRAMFDYMTTQFTHSRRVWQDLRKFRSLKRELEVKAGRELTDVEAMAKSPWKPKYQSLLLAALSTKVSNGLEASEDLLKVADPQTEHLDRGSPWGEQVPALRQAIAKLPELQREAVTAFYLEGKPLEEFARQRGVTVQAVSFHKTRGFRALCRLFNSTSKVHNQTAEIVSMKLINQTAVRKYALEVLKQERPALADKFTRIGSEFFDAIEAATRAAVANRITNHNSSGKTLR